MGTENPLKTVKNGFYFTLKPLFVLKIFKFLSRIFGHVEKQLDQKDKVNFKTSGVATWKTKNCNTQLPNISRSKDNQKITFDQLIECDMRNNFIKKS